MNIRRLPRLLLTATLLLWSIGSYAAGNYSGPDRDENGNIVPTPKGEKCVEPTDVIRANHMKFLLHQRDQTMHKGIRTKQHSLKECINCHATPDENGKIARVFDEDSKHFCASCHQAASVKLDCFECHTDRPEDAFSLQKLPADHAMSERLAPAASRKPHVVLNSQGQQDEQK